MDISEFVRLTLLILIFGIMSLILLDQKYSLKKTLIIYGSFLVISIAINVSICTLFGWSIFARCYVLVTNGCATIGLFFLSKRKGLPIIFTMLTATVCTNFPAMAATYIRAETGCSIWLEILVRLIIGIPLIIILYRYLRPSYLQMLTEMEKGWGYLCLIPGLYYAIVIINMADLSSAPSEYRRIFLNIFLSFSITAVSYGVIFTLFGKILREAEMHDEQQMLKIQMQAMEREADILKENEEKMQISRHNSRHYIAQIKTLLESGNIQDVLRILGGLDEQYSNTKVPYYCNNPTVNAILVYYIRKAELEKITVETDCRLPEKLPAEASELAMVLANAIENAIHACAILPENRERIIKIKMVPSPQLAIEVANSYTGTIKFDENGLPISLRSGHGLGTRSISAFIEKYDGIMEYSTEGSLFRLRLLIGTE